MASFCTQFCAILINRKKIQNEKFENSFQKFSCFWITNQFKKKKRKKMLSGMCFIR